MVLSAYSYPDKGSPVWYIPELAEGSGLVERLNPNDQNTVELVAGKHVVHYNLCLLIRCLVLR